MGVDKESLRRWLFFVWKCCNVYFFFDKKKKKCATFFSIFVWKNVFHVEDVKGKHIFKVSTRLTCIINKLCI